jgi:hypothetical protein
MTTTINSTIPNRTEWYEQGETLYCACEFLGVRDILQCAATSNSLRTALIGSDKAARFWSAYVDNMITKNIASAVNMSLDNNAPIEPINLSVNYYIQTLKRLLTGQVERLEQVYIYTCTYMHAYIHICIYIYSR